MPGQSGYVVGWGALALINAGLAQGKSRSGLFWVCDLASARTPGDLLIVLLPMTGAEARPLGRSEWAVVGVVLAVLVLLVVLSVGGLMVAGSRAPVVGG